MDKAIPDPADRAVRFIKNLTHSSGDYARQPFRLRAWQEQIVRSLFSVGPNGLRRHRTALLMLPRKNGKTELCAALALYGLLGDGEIGAQVISAAADREQAGFVFNAAVAMIRADPELEAVCEIVESRKRIVYRATGSVYMAISAEAYSKHGFNASMVIYDELHAAPNRELWDVLRTSQGARKQPLLIAISTAGFDRHSILWQIYDYAKKVRDGVVNDPSFLPVIYEAPGNADWMDEQVWAACNPALGDFRSLEDMRILAREAKEMPQAENSFRRLYLNQWTEQATRWLPMDKWEDCRGGASRASLRGRRCFVGLDLSATRDLTAVEAVFPDDTGFDVLSWYFVPKESARIRSNRDRVPYEQWIKDCRIIATDGEVIDYNKVRALLQELSKEFVIVALAYDPWNATHLLTQLREIDGINCIEIRQGYASLSAPTKAVEAAVLSRRLRHDGHPVLQWCMSNVMIETDGLNVKPSKKVSTERIDGAVALTMAVAAMELQIQKPDPEYKLLILGGRR